MPSLIISDHFVGAVLLLAESCAWTWLRVEHPLDMAMDSVGIGFTAPTFVQKDRTANPKSRD